MSKDDNNNNCPMKWPNKVAKIKNLNDGDVNCLEWAVYVAKKKMRLRFSTIFRCGWIQNDGHKSRFHVLPIYYNKMWFVENYIPGKNDRDTIDVQPYNYPPDAKGLDAAAKGFSNYFLVKMSEYYRMLPSNCQSVIEVVSPEKFKEALRICEGVDMTQAELIKRLFG